MTSLPSLTTYLDATLPQYGLVGPTKFSFVPGVTPLSTWESVLGGSLVYLAVIFGIQFIMSKYDIKPIKLRELFVIHNLALVAVSAVLLYESLRIVGQMYLKGGLLYALCDKDAFGGGLEFWYYRELIQVSEAGYTGGELVGKGPKTGTGRQTQNEQTVLGSRGHETPGRRYPGPTDSNGSLIRIMEPQSCGVGRSNL